MCVPTPLVKLHISFTQASLAVAIANKVGKATQKAESPHHRSFQNLARWPLPTIKESLLLTTCHSLLIAFHNPMPYPPLSSLEHQPLCFSPYFPLITWFHKAPLSFANLQFHLHKNALLREERHFTPKPLFLLSKQTSVHLTSCGFSLRAPLPHKKISLNLLLPQSDCPRQNKPRHEVNW